MGVPGVPPTSPSEWAAKPTPRQECVPGINGIGVMVPRPGANDVRHLAPGVYFWRLESESTILTRKAIKID